jgi:tape measure domain-containing protein
MTQIATLIIDMAANISRLQSDMQQARASVTGAAGDMQRAANTARGALEALGAGISIAAIVASVQQVSKAIIDAEAQAVKFRAAMGSIVGAENVARELDYVRSTARQLGLDLDATSNAYLRLSASARGTALAGDETRNIFTAVSRAATTLGLSSAEADGALLAISQMMSKGTVQAEELRGQLGERLPGAFQIAARAMGVSTAELGKMLEAGQVVADDFLPKFARELMKMGESAEKASGTAARELQRMKNAWGEFTQAVADSGTANVIGGVLGRFASAFANIAEQIRIAKAQGAGFFGQMRAAIDAPFGGTAQQRLEGATRDYNNASGPFANLDRMAAQARIDGAARDLSVLNADKGYADETSRGRFGEIAREAARAAAETDKLRISVGSLRREMSGQDKDFQAHLTSLRQAFERGVIPTQKEYVDLVTKLIEKEGGVKDAMKARSDAQKEGERAAKKLNEAYFEGIGISKDYSERVRELETLYKTKKYSTEQYVDAIKRLASEQPIVRENVRKEADAQKYLADMQREGAEAREKYADSLLKGQAEAEKALATVTEERDKLGMTKEQLVELTAKRYEAMAATAEQRAEEASLTGEYGEQIKALERTAQAYRDAARVVREGGRVQAGIDDARRVSEEAKKAADAWRQQTEQIERSITDSLMRGFESGKGFAQGLVDTLKSMFKTLVLRPVISAIVQPVAGGLTGLLGLSGLATAGTGSGGAAGTAGAVGSVASGASGLGGLLGGFGGSLGAFGSSMGASMATMFSGPGLFATLGEAATLVQGGAVASGLGMGAGAALPYLGAAMAIVSLLAKKRGGPKLGGSFTTGGLDRFYTPTTADTEVGGIGSGVISSIAQYANMLGGSASGIGLSLGFDSDPQGTAGSRISALLRGATGQTIYESVNRDVGRDDAVLQAELGNETARLIIAGLKDAQLPTAVRDFLASIDVARVTAGTLDSIMAQAGALVPKVAGLDGQTVLYSNEQRALLAQMGPQPRPGGTVLFDAGITDDGMGPRLPLSPVDQVAAVLGDAPTLQESIASAVADATGAGTPTSELRSVSSEMLDVMIAQRADHQEIATRHSAAFTAMHAELQQLRSAFERINIIATMSSVRPA